MSRARSAADLRPDRGRDVGAGRGALRAITIVGTAIAITLWIFSRTGTPFAGFDWIELMEFHKHYYREQLLAGHVPLWNPYVGFGRPFLADIETATLYPPNLLFLLPDFWALPLCIALHTGLILSGAIFFGRELKLAWGTSLLAGATFALGASLSGRLQGGQVQVFCTLAFLLWWWALAWRLWRAPAWRVAGAFAAVTAGCVLSGSPPFIWAMGWTVAVWLLAWSAGQPWRSFLRGAGALGAAGAWGLALAAVQFVPFLELLGQGNRARVNPAFANLSALPVRDLVSLVWPTTNAREFFWEMNLFAGVAAPLGLLFVPQVWRDRAGRAFFAVAIVGILLALEPLGIAGRLAPWLPGMGALRTPSRYAFAAGWSLFLMLLLAWRGWTAIIPRWRLMLVGLIQLGSLLWAVEAQARQYATWSRWADEDAIAWRAAEFAESLAPVPLRVGLKLDMVRANSGVLHGFSNLNAFANPGLARMWEAGHRLAGLSPRLDSPSLTLELAGQSRTALRKWGVQFGWDREQERFFFDPAASPRARAVYRMKLVSEASAAAQQWWDDAGDVVFLEGAGPVADGEAGTVLGARVLSITSYESDSVEVRWDSARAGWLVLAEPWYPGWQARVGETWVDTQPANGWMRAVAVPAGSQTVRFEFRPRSLRLGGIISGIALAGLIGALVWPRKKTDRDATRRLASV